MASNFQWKMYEQSQNIQWLGYAWHGGPKGGTTLMMGYLIALALLFVLSLTWHDQPAREAEHPDRTGTNKRQDDPQPNHPL